MKPDKRESPEKKLTQKRSKKNLNKNSASKFQSSAKDLVGSLDEPGKGDLASADFNLDEVYKLLN